jgi:hypothetical protein
MICSGARPSSVSRPNFERARFGKAALIERLEIVSPVGFEPLACKNKNAAQRARHREWTAAATVIHAMASANIPILGLL